MAPKPLDTQCPCKEHSNSGALAFLGPPSDDTAYLIAFPSTYSFALLVCRSTSPPGPGHDLLFSVPDQFPASGLHFSSEEHCFALNPTPATHPSCSILALVWLACQCRYFLNPRLIPLNYSAVSCIYSLFHIHMHVDI